MRRMVRFLAERRSAIINKDISLGAQTKRRGGAGPVRILLGGKAILDNVLRKEKNARIFLTKGLLWAMTDLRKRASAPDGRAASWRRHPAGGQLRPCCSHARKSK